MNTLIRFLRSSTIVCLALFTLTLAGCGGQPEYSKAELDEFQENTERRERCELIYSTDKRRCTDNDPSSTKFIVVKIYWSHIEVLIPVKGQKTSTTWRSDGVQHGSSVFDLWFWFTSQGSYGIPLGFKHPHSTRLSTLFKFDASAKTLMFTRHMRHYKASCKKDGVGNHAFICTNPREFTPSPSN